MRIHERPAGSKMIRGQMVPSRVISRLAVVWLLTSILVACGGSPPAPPPASADPTSTRAASADPRPLVLSASDVVSVQLIVVEKGVTIAGSLDPADQLEIRAQISGQLEKVMVDDGETVAKGAVLATYRTTVVEAAVAAAQAQLTAAQRDLDAAQLLHREGALAARDLAQARVAHDAAKAQATIEEDRLQHTRVTAPSAGTITAKMASAGEAVSAGQTLFELVDVRRLRLDGAVSASEVGAIEIGQSVRLHIESYSSRVIEGTVSHIDPVADALTRQVTVHVDVANRDRSLIGGLYAEGKVITTPPDTPGLPVVPVTAIVRDDGVDAVFVVAQGTLEKRTVRLGARDDERAIRAVVSGLAAGEQVVRVPAPDLAAGVTVQVAETAAPKKVSPVTSTSTQAAQGGADAG